jgi:hypothetical protein
MKKLLSIILLLCAVYTHAQSEWLSEVGLPPEFSVFEDYQIQGKTTNTIIQNEVSRNVYTYGSSAQYEQFTGYPLNLIYNYIYSYNSNYIGMEAGAFEFYKTGESKMVNVGPFAGNTYYYGWQSVEIRARGTGFDMVVKSYPYMNVERNGYPAIKPWLMVKRQNKGIFQRTTERLTSDQIQARCGCTEFDIAEYSTVIFHFVKVPRETHITSIFALITRSGDTYSNASLINGKPWQESVNKTTSFGKTLSTLKFSWVLYNGCSIGPQTSETNWTGNSGQCFRKMYALSDPRSQSITVIPGTGYFFTPDDQLTFNTQQPAVLELVMHRTPMLEKNTEQQGYWNLLSGKRKQTLK